MRLADDAVPRAVTRDVPDPDVVSAAHDLALRELDQPDKAPTARLDALKSELRGIEAKLGATRRRSPTPGCSRRSCALSRFARNA